MAVKILELCNVAPPKGSVQPCTLPLTFFDLVWYMLPFSTERVFFYPVPHCSTATFHSTHLPKLKLSLSLALKLFYPLAGRLVPETATDLPCISYSDGDSVVLTVAESDDDLQELMSNGSKDSARFRCLVPTLPKLETNQRYQPVVALQVTLLPEQGIAVGITVLHVAMDGSSSSHFMRTWASICRLQMGEEPPFYDRSQISEPVDLQGPIFSKIKFVRNIHHGLPDVPSQPDVVRATFHLTTVHIEDLRKWVVTKSSDGSGARFSSFTLAVSLVWTCILKARRFTPKQTEGLIISVDCRARLDPPVPSSYFGNVVTGCLVEVEGSGLVSEEGLVTAATAIRDALREFPVGDGPLRSKFESNIMGSHRYATMKPLSLAGSPSLRVYDVDFGWGRPGKVEMVSIDRNDAMSLSEIKRDAVEGGGGLEIGLVLPVNVMEEFTKFFHTTLKTCS